MLHLVYRDQRRETSAREERAALSRPKPRGAPLLIIRNTHAVARGMVASLLARLGRWLGRANETPGCTDASMSNYSPEATVDDGSCVAASSSRLLAVPSVAALNVLLLLGGVIFWCDDAVVLALVGRVLELKRLLRAVAARAHEHASAAMLLFAGWLRRSAAVLRRWCVAALSACGAARTAALSTLTHSLDASKRWYAERREPPSAVSEAAAESHGFDRLWVATLDESSGHVYYYHTITGEARWDAPNEDEEDRGSFTTAASSAARTPAHVTAASIGAALAPALQRARESVGVPAVPSPQRSFSSHRSDDELGPSDSVSCAGGNNEGEGVAGARLVVGLEELRAQRARLDDIESRLLNAAPSGAGREEVEAQQRALEAENAALRAEVEAAQAAVDERVKEAEKRAAADAEAALHSKLLQRAQRKYGESRARELAKALTTPSGGSLALPNVQRTL